MGVPITCRQPANCPKCQGAGRSQWLTEGEADLLAGGILPTSSSHCPAEVAAIAFYNKGAGLTICCFKRPSEAMRWSPPDPKHLGARIGMTCRGLHTWGRP